MAECQAVLPFISSFTTYIENLKSSNIKLNMEYLSTINYDNYKEMTINEIVKGQ